VGGFDRIFAAPAAEGGPNRRVMIDSTHLKAHCTAASLLKEGLCRTKGSLNTQGSTLPETVRAARRYS